MSALAMRARRARAGWLFATPWLIGFVVLTALPMAASLLLSFTDWSGLNVEQIRWVGLANYARALGGDDPAVAKALMNTAWYALVAVPVGLAVALGLALLLNQQLPGMKVFRTLFYMPSVIGGVATVMMWTWVFNAEFGLLNTMLRGGANALVACGVDALAGWHPPNWLGDPTWTKPALVVMSTWGAGAGMLIFLAALQNVPEQLYEAARIDGAGRLRQFWSITLPQISGAIYFNLIMGLIHAFQVFNDAFILFKGGGGAKDSALFFVVHLYTKAFQDFELGYASALAWILFTIVLALTLLVVAWAKKWVTYDVD